MRQTMILTGEINLKTVTDPTVPFGRVTKELGEADVVFANLECLLADPPAEYATHQAAFHRTREGFYAGPVAGEALKLAGFDGVGCANNVTYGEDAIRASLARLKELGLKFDMIDKDLGYELRCADPIPFDVEYVRNLGYGAVKFLLSPAAEENGVVITFVGGNMVPRPFQEMIDPATKKPKLVWEYQQSQRFGLSSPALADGVLYMPDDSGELFAFDAKTGKRLWTYRYATEVRGAPLVADNKIYIVDVKGRFSIIPLDGKKKPDAADVFEYTFKETINGRPVQTETNGTPIAVNGRVYFTTRGMIEGGPSSGTSDEDAPERARNFDFLGTARRIAREKYPALVEPRPELEGVTLVFEFLHPETRVITNYGAREDLVLLACFDRGDHRYRTFAELKELAADSGGRVEVVLEPMGGDAVRVAIAVERPETLDLLRRDAGQLDQVLARSNLRLEGGLQFSLQQQGQGWGERNGGTHWAPATPGSAAAGPAGEPETAPQPRATSRESGIDIIV